MITPPPELVASLLNSAPHGIGDCGVTREIWLLHNAYALGADQELEACIEWVGSMFHGYKTWTDELRAARRPKPPSDKELALEALQSMRIDPELIKIINGNTDLKAKYDTIRRALEQLND